MSIKAAIRRGFPPSQILTQLKRRFPRMRSQIDNAISAGYTAEYILRHIDSGNSKTRNKSENAEDYLTEHEKVMKRDKEQKTKARNQAGVAALAALGLGGAGYRAIRAGRAITGQILPAQARAPLNLPPGRGPVTLSGGPPKPSPRPSGGAPNIPPGPSPSQGPKVPSPSPIPPQAPTPAAGRSVVTRDPVKTATLIKDIKEDTKIKNLLRQGFDTSMTAGILRTLMPKDKLAVLERSEGGLEGAIEDYSQFLQTEEALQPEGSRPEIAKRQEVQEQPEPFQQAEEEEIPDYLRSYAERHPQKEEVQSEKKPQSALRERIMEVANPIGKSEKEIEKSFKNNFSIPNYHYAGEPKEEFKKRKMIYDAVDKTAKMLAKGKSFMDLPYQKDVQYSTASDVLKYIAGAPNAFESLLDEEEKNEIAEAVEGEGNIYGANITPNLVWNLFLSVEPKIAKMVPPSIKGAKDKPKGGKMGTTEMRRFLTHAVYGVLSGKTVSSELADKIERISSAAKTCDSIAKAAHAGNARKVEEYIEKLSNDDALFMEIMSQEIDTMLGLPPERREYFEEKEREDSKNASAVKAAFTRRAKKGSNED